MANVKTREQDFLRSLKSSIEEILGEDNSTNFSKLVNTLSKNIIVPSDPAISKSVKKLANMNKVLEKSKDDQLFQKAYLSWVKKICESSRTSEEIWEKIYDVFVNISNNASSKLFNQIGNLDLDQIQNVLTDLKNLAQFYADLGSIANQNQFISNYKNSMNPFMIKARLLEKNEEKISKALKDENKSYHLAMEMYQDNPEYIEKIQAAFREYKFNLFNNLFNSSVEKITENYQKKLKELNILELQLVEDEETFEDNLSSQVKDVKRALLGEFNNCTDQRNPELSNQNEQNIGEISPALIPLTPIKIPTSILKTANTPSSPSKKVHFAKKLVQVRSFSPESDSDNSNSPSTSLQTSRSALQITTKVESSNLPIQPSKTDSPTEKNEVTTEERMQQKYSKPRLKLLEEIRNKKNKYEESKALLLEFLRTEQVQPEIHKRTMTLIDAVAKIAPNLPSVASKTLLVTLSLLVTPKDNDVKKLYQQFSKDLAQFIPDNFVAKLISGAMLALGAAVLAVGVLICTATLGGGAILGSFAATTGASLMLIGGLSLFSEGRKSAKAQEIKEICKEMDGFASSMPKL